MSRCAACPADPSDPCAGGHYCDLAASGDPNRRLSVRNVCRLKAGGTPEPARRFDAGLTRRVLGCPDRSRVGCGCAGRWACARAGGAEVTYPACLDCVREEFGERP